MDKSPLVPVSVRYRRIVREPKPAQKGKRLRNKPHRDLPVDVEAPRVSRHGVKTKMTASLLAKIEAACHFTGSPTYEFLAAYVGVHMTTFHTWLREFRGLREKIDRWRAQGMQMLRRKAFRVAMKGDGKMLRYFLDRRDPDFRPVQQIDLNDVPANHDRSAMRPDVL